MRSGVMKRSRYSHQGATFSSGRPMMSSTFGCGCACASSATTHLRLQPSWLTTSSIHWAISGRCTSKGAAVTSAGAGLAGGAGGAGGGGGWGGGLLRGSAVHEERSGAECRKQSVTPVDQDGSVPAQEPTSLRRE